MTEISKQISNSARALGIKEGDTVLVHSSLRSLGGATAREVIEGLTDCLGSEGTLVFPTLSYMNCNPSKPNFDYYETKSNVGYLPEYFRTEVEGVLRNTSFRVISSTKPLAEAIRRLQESESSAEKYCLSAVG